MNKIASHGLFAALGLSLGIFGTIIGLSANLNPTSSSSSASSQPTTYDSLAITEMEAVENFDNLYLEEEALQPYFDDYYVMEVAPLRNGEGYFIIFSEEVIETIQGTEVRFERIHLRHLNLSGHTAWQHYLTPSDEYKLKSSTYGPTNVQLNIETILVEANAVVIPFSLENVFFFYENDAQQVVELEGNFSHLGVEAGDQYITAFVEINLDTYAFTTFGKKEYASDYVEFEEVHYLAQYRYLVSYDLDRRYHDITEPFLGLDLEALPQQGYVISEFIIAVNENNDRVFTEDLYSGFFSDTYLDLDFSNFSLMNGTSQQGYNDLLVLNIEYEFYKGWDENDVTLTETSVAFVGEPLFSLDTLNEIETFKDLAYSDDRVDFVNLEVEVIVALFDRDIVLEVKSSVIHYFTGNLHSIGILMSLDPHTMDIYVISWIDEFNFNGVDDQFQIISSESVIDHYTLVNDRYVATTVLEATYRVLDLFKFGEEFLIIAQSNAFDELDYDNGFLEGLVVLLYDHSFNLLDGVAIYGNKPVYEDFGSDIVGEQTVVLYLYTESTEGSPEDLYNDEQNYYQLTIVLN